MRRPTQNLRWQSMRTNRRRSVQFSIFRPRTAPDQASPETDTATETNEKENGTACSKFDTRPLNSSLPLNGSITQRNGADD